MKELVIIWFSFLLATIFGWGIESCRTGFGLAVTVAITLITVLLTILLLGDYIYKTVKENEKKKQQELHNRQLEQVKETSQMYKDLLKLNSEQKFDNGFLHVFNYNKSFPNKASFDRQSLEEFFYDNFKKDKKTYKELSLKVQNNSVKWNNYLNKYNKLKVNSKESFIEEVSVENYNLLENEAYEEGRLKKPVTVITVYVLLVYTTPAGRNTYKKENTFYLDSNEIEIISKEIEESEEKIKQLQEKRKKESEEKRLKEQKLRDVNKLEKQLNEREKSINLKEEEFRKATEGHIYSVDTKNLKYVEEKDEHADDCTPYQKLKKLRIQYENDEITREEYEAQRNALL